MMSLLQEADSHTTLDKFIKNEFNPKIQNVIKYMDKGDNSNVEFRLCYKNNKKESTTLYDNLQNAVKLTENSYYDGITFTPGNIKKIIETTCSGNVQFPYMDVLVGYNLNITRTK